MDEHALIDYQWERADKYARRFAMLNFTVQNPERLASLRNNIFEYFRKRHLNLDYSEVDRGDNQYCWTCLAIMPKHHFC